MGQLGMSVLSRGLLQGGYSGLNYSLSFSGIDAVFQAGVRNNKGIRTRIPVRYLPLQRQPLPGGRWNR